MTLAEQADGIRSLLLGMTETTWPEDKDKLIKALLRMRRDCEQEGRRRIMHELEAWISVVQVCENPREVAIAKVPEAIQKLRRAVA